MIVYGGASHVSGIYQELRSSGRYNPVTDSWTPMSQLSAFYDPTSVGGSLESIVWTGEDMIIWGGTSLNFGYKYSPVTDVWTQISVNDTPHARSGHTAVWTGSEMIL